MFLKGFRPGEQEWQGYGFFVFAHGLTQKGLLLPNPLHQVGLFVLFRSFQLFLKARKRHEPGKDPQQAGPFGWGDSGQNHGRHALKSFYFRQAFK